MKKVIKIICFSLLSVIGVVLVVGFFLPSTYVVQRTVLINAQPDAVHVYVDDLGKWPEWGPWLEEDPTIKTTLGPITAGAGASQTWVGDSGTGALTLISSEPGSGVKYGLSFDDGAFTSVAEIQYKVRGDATEVVWIMTGDVGSNLFERYFAVGMDSMVGPMFEQGLQNLKVTVESTN